MRGGCGQCPEDEGGECGDLRGAVNPNVTGVCCSSGKSGRCALCAPAAAGRAGLAGLGPGPAGTPRPRGGSAGAGTGVSLCNNWLLRNGL